MIRGPRGPQQGARRKVTPVQNTSQRKGTEGQAVVTLTSTLVPNRGEWQVEGRGERQTHAKGVHYADVIEINNDAK